MINVSWQDASQFIAWLSRKTGDSYRLPTEVAWEYAARGVTKASEPHPPFSTGTTINYEQANYGANFVFGDGKMGVFRQKTLAVGTWECIWSAQYARCRTAMIATAYRPAGSVLPLQIRAGRRLHRRCANTVGDAPGAGNFCVRRPVLNER